MSDSGDYRPDSERDLAWRRTRKTQDSSVSGSTTIALSAT